MRICYRLSLEPLNIVLPVNYQANTMVAVINLPILQLKLNKLGKKIFKHKFWPENINCQIFLQQRWVYLGSAENYSLGSEAMVSYVQIPCTARRGECDYRREKEAGRAAVEKGSMTFHWLSPGQGRRRVCLLPVALCYPLRA